MELASGQPNSPRLCQYCKYLASRRQELLCSNIPQMVVSYSNRRANHWIGTSKMGLDDGTKPNGTAVVDTNTKVYGTDNLFVVDASVFPGQVTTNPSAYIVTVAEHASDLLLALNSTTSS